METLFENKYLRDKEWAKSIYGYIYFGRPAVKVLFALLILYTCIAIVEMALLKSLNPLLIVTVFLPLVYFGILIFSYFSMIRLSLKRDLEMTGKMSELMATVTDEHIHMTTEDNSTNLRLLYGDIKKAVRTKKFIFLMSKTKLVYALKRDGFTVGDDDGFVEYLKSRNVKVKGKKK